MAFFLHFAGSVAINLCKHCLWRRWHVPLAIKRDASPETLMLEDAISFRRFRFRWLVANCLLFRVMVVFFSVRSVPPECNFYSASFFMCIICVYPIFTSSGVGIYPMYNVFFNASISSNKRKTGLWWPASLLVLMLRMLRMHNVLRSMFPGWLAIITGGC